MKRVWLAVAFLVLAGLGGIAYQTWLEPARSQTPPPRAAAGVPVTVATAANMPIPVRLDTIGTVQPVAAVTVKSRIDGFIDSVLIQDGQYVKAGDIMFRLDPRAAQAQVLQMQAQVARDQAQLANAKRNVERDAPLVGKDFMSRQQFDTDTTTARALEATVAADTAQLENAKVLLSYNTIPAPIDGRVGTIAIKSGNSIKSNDLPLATINQIRPIYVAFNLPQSELPALRAALSKGAGPVSVRPQGDEGAPITGAVQFFDNSVDVTSGTIAVRAQFANDDRRLWPGQFVNVSMTTRTDADALVVPPAAIQVGQDTNYVYVVKSDLTVELRPVKVSRTVDGKSVIASGVSAGERVVTDGQMRLRNGVHVDIRSSTNPVKPDPAT